MQFRIIVVSYMIFEYVIKSSSVSDKGTQNDQQNAQTKIQNTLDRHYLGHDEPGVPLSVPERACEFFHRVSYVCGLKLVSLSHFLRNNLVYF